jgi:HAE1 family hydrophobic/amphiphilic exporter-1
MGALYQAVSKGFIPRQDTGVINGVTRAPEGTTFKTMTRYQQGLAERVQQNSNIDSLLSTAGQGAGGEFGDNVGRFIIRLKSKADKERTIGADEVIQQIRRQTAGNQDVQLFLSNPPAIRIGGTISTSDYLYTVTAPDLKQLYGPAQELIARMQKLPILLDVASNLQLRNPEIQLKVLRDRASSLGVTSEQIEAALYNAFGGRKISTIFGASDQYQVLIEVDRKYQTDINSMDTIFIQSSTGAMVPINAVAEVRSGVGPISVAHAGQLPAVMISFNLAPGVSVGDAVATIQGVAGEVLPNSVTGQFAGNAKAFQEAFRSLPLLVIVTVILIYMILAILYEHYGYPLTILTALPFAGFGALLTLLVFRQELNIFSFVGIILLIGLVKKNGIMMVDFALQMQRDQGMSPKDAIIEACSVRFRPIMMTTMAAIFATIPIAIGYGAGAETRQPLGIAVVGGLVFSQFLTLYVTPVFYVTLDRLTRYFTSRKSVKPAVEVG